MLNNGGWRPHVRWSVERTASLAVAKPRCSGGQTKVDLRAEWPLQGVPSEKVASGRCSPISTNHVALFGLSCTRLRLVSTLHLALAIFQQGAPCFGHRVIRLSLGRRLVDLLPVAQRTNAFTNGVVDRPWVVGREFESHVHHENAF